MALLQLPHTAGCVVCGPSNPHGLKLSLLVDEATGRVSCAFTPTPAHIGFEGIVHGGVLATVLDEAMVWAATWSGRRFCVCGELTVRYRQIAPVGRPLKVEAAVISSRARLLQTTGTILDETGATITSAEAKYVPVPKERNFEFVGTLIEEPTSTRAARVLQSAANVSPE